MSFLYVHKKANFPQLTPSQLIPWKIAMCLTLFLFSLPSASSTVYAQDGSCPNLVTDGSFESGRGWNIKSNGNYSVFSDVQAHTGGQSAYLAGMDNADDLLSTTVELPDGAPSLTFSFWWKVNSEDTRDPSDELKVQVADSNGEALKTLFTVGSNRAAKRWRQSSMDLSQFAGQTIQLQFAAETDGANITDFFVDDVEVTTCGG
ncbi:MAG: choice-of-anchor J domain-containing protein [Caldilineaceae bacterium]